MAPHEAGLRIIPSAFASAAIDKWGVVF